MTRFATGATWEIPDYKLNQVQSTYTGGTVQGWAPPVLLPPWPGQRTGSPITVYARVQCREPKKGQEKLKGSIILWRRFNFPIFQLFIYGQNQLLKWLEIGNRKYALNLKNICFLYNLYFSPIDVLVKKSSDFWSHFYFIWLLTPTLVKDKI